MPFSSSSSMRLFFYLTLLVVNILPGEVISKVLSSGAISSSSSLPYIIMWYVCTYFPVGSSCSSRYQYIVWDYCDSSLLPSAFSSSYCCIPSISRFNSWECFMAEGPPNCRSDDFDSLTLFFIIFLLSDLNSLFRFGFFRSSAACFISFRPAMTPAILGIFC